MKHPFIPMTKKEYEGKDYLNCTTRIENAWYSSARGGQISREFVTSLNELHFKVVGWYHPYCFAGGFREPIKKLTEFFGFKPTAYHTFSYRVAVWAFSWDSQVVLLFKSKRGISVQVSEEFPVDRLKDFYQDLMEVLKVL